MNTVEPRTSSAFAPRDLGLLFSLAAMWGLSFLFIKVAVADVTPLWIVAARVTLGGVLLAVIVRLRGVEIPRERVVWGHLLVLALVTNMIPWVGIAWAQQFLPSGVTAMTNSLTPIATLTVAVAIGQESLTTRRLAGLAIAVAGTLVVVASELGTPERAVALVVAVSATLMYGAGAVYARHFVTGRVRPLATAFGQLAWSVVILVPLAAATGPAPLPGRVSLTAIGSLAALGIFGTGLAFLVFYVLMERVGATNATLVTYLIPVVGVTAGIVVLGERFGANVPVGGALIIAGVWLAQRTVRSDPARSPNPVGSGRR